MTRRGQYTDIEVLLARCTISSGLPPEMARRNIQELHTWLSEPADAISIPTGRFQVTRYDWPKIWIWAGLLAFCILTWFGIGTLARMAWMVM